MKVRKSIASFLALLMLSMQMPIVAIAEDQPATPPADTTTQGSTPSAKSSDQTPATEKATTPPETGSNGTAGSQTGTDGQPEGTTGTDASKTTDLPKSTDESKSTDTTTAVPKKEKKTGPQEPTGKAPHWVFNTVTGKWEEADRGSFTWDSKSGYWLSPKYYYDTRTGWYKILTASDIAAKPAYLITAPDAPKVISTPIGDFVVGSPEYEMAKTLGLIVDPSILSTGPNSTNSATLNNSNTALIDFTNIVKLANTIAAGSTTGDAKVGSNTVAGDATSGNASVMANIVNLLNSIWNSAAGPVVTFVKNIFGNFTGDITLDMPATPPTATAATGESTAGLTGPGSVNNSTLNNSNDLKVNVASSGEINNDVNLKAKSGNAVVDSNTVGGNATSGDAHVALNLINMINSAISAGGGFVGILNVYGNLSGDILFGNNFVNQVLGNTTPGGSTASNGTTGPGSINNATVNNANNLSVNANQNTSIDNNIKANAKSGSADISGNASAGSATTGTATTQSSVANLTGKNVFGDSAVLVIVNVMGHWLGGIMNLPATVASALLGSSNAGIVDNGTTGPDSVNNSTVNNSNNAALNLNDNLKIKNNVTIDAQSGNAAVTDNTKAGNAKTGNANVLSSVANITNSTIGVRKWFGILIVNVFGDWFGSVGKDTEAGNAQVASSGAPVITNPAVTVHQDHTATSTGATSGVTAATGSSDQAAVTTSTNDTQIAPAVSVLGSQVQQQAAQDRKVTFVLLAIALFMLALAAGLASFERRIRAQA